MLFALQLLQYAEWGGEPDPSQPTSVLLFRTDDGGAVWQYVSVVFNGAA